MGLFSKKTETVPAEGNELYTDRKFNTYWMLGLSPFADYTAEQMQEAMDKEVRKLSRVLKTDPVPMVKVKTQEKFDKLQSISGNTEAFERERDQAILMFNEDVIRSTGGTTADESKINSAITLTGWKDGTGLMTMDGMTFCGSCGYINRKTKKCLKCGKRL